MQNATKIEDIEEELKTLRKENTDYRLKLAEMTSMYNEQKVELGHLRSMNEQLVESVKNLSNKIK